MCALFKNLFVGFILIFPGFCFAYDDVCPNFGYDVDISIKNSTKDNVKITSSSENLSGKLGYTLSKMGFDYRFFMVPVRISDGYCISLRGVDIDVFFPEFDVTIDKRLKPDTCAYNVVLNHEMDHVNVYKSVLNDNMKDIRRALTEAIRTVKPVFVETLDQQDIVQEDIIKKIEKYKSVAAIQEKIQNSLDEENKKIDTRGDDYQVWKCEDFYQEMMKSGERVRID